MVISKPNVGINIPKLFCFFEFFGRLNNILEVLSWKSFLTHIIPKTTLDATLLREAEEYIFSPAHYTKKLKTYFRLECKEAFLSIYHNISVSLGSKVSHAKEVK